MECPRNDVRKHLVGTYVEGLDLTISEDHIREAVSLLYTISSSNLPFMSKGELRNTEDIREPRREEAVRERINIAIRSCSSSNGI